MTEKDDSKFRRVIEKAWADEQFRKRLKSDPVSTLKGEGIEPPPGAEIEVIESTSSKRYFVLPPTPDAGLSAKALKEKSDSSDYRALVHLLYNVNCC